MDGIPFRVCMECENKNAVGDAGERSPGEYLVEMAVTLTSYECEDVMKGG